MIIRKQDGVITVFLSIILLVIIALAATLVDGARINSADSQVRRAAQSAAQSALANYNSELKEQYGFFALGGNDVKVHADDCLYYIEKSLIPNKDLPSNDLITQNLNQSYDGHFIDFYGYSIEDVEVLLYYDLEQNEVLKQQILEYMKYRAPKELISKFLRKLDILKKSGKTAEIIKEKVEVEAVLDKIGNEQKQLSDTILIINSFDKPEYVQTTLENTITLIHEFNILTDNIGLKKTKLIELNKSLNQYQEESRSLESSIKSKHKSLEVLIKTINDKKNNSQTSNDSDLLTKVQNLENEISKLQDRLSIVSGIINDYNSNINKLETELNNEKNKRADVFDNIGQANKEVELYLKKFKHHNNGAKNKIKSLVRGSVDVQSEIKEFRTKINSHEYKENIITEARHQIEYDLKNLEDKVKGVTQNSIKNKFGDSSFNSSKIPDEIKSKVNSYIGGLKAELDTSLASIEKSAVEDLIYNIGYPTASNYEILDTSIINMTYLKGEFDRIWWAIGNESITESDKKFDKKSVESISLIISMVDRYANNIEYIKFFGKEPSEEIKNYAKDIENRDTKQLDTAENIDSIYKNKEFLQDENIQSSKEVDELFKDLPSKRENEPDTFGLIIDDETKTDSATINNSLDFLINISNSIQEGSENFRDNLYINEYILGIFRCAVEANEGQIDSDFTGKYQRSAYFDEEFGNVEIEYIINGHQNPVKNLRRTQAQIYAIRTAMNMLHVYSDPDKMQIAIKLGTLASGPIPLLSPLITSVIVFGWSSLESLIDINMLMNGEEVPFYKISEEEWKLGLGGITSLIKDSVVNESIEMLEYQTEAIIDKIVDSLFYQMEQGILEVAVTVDTTAQGMFDTFEDEINTRIDSVLEVIGNDDIKNEIKEILDPEQLTGTIEAQITQSLVKAQEKAEGILEDKKEQISSTIKKQINSSLNTIKLDINEKLHNYLLKSDTFKSFVGNQGKNVLNKMTAKKFNLNFSYQDYLRILLLMKNENTKLRRIMDLIELNMQVDNEDFHIQHCHTLIEVKTRVSIKNLFINGGVLPDRLRKRIKNRSYITNYVIEGY